MVVGGFQSKKDQRARGSNKTIVMGLVERKGRLRAGPIPDTAGKTLESVVTQNVEVGSRVSTDDATGYSRLEAFHYRHDTVNHSEGEYVKGDTHTNTLEGHWSLFQRAVRGTHVSISSKHMWKYVAEFSYRRNFRHSHETMFNRLVASFSQPRLVET
jgi:transposase